VVACSALLLALAGWILLRQSRAADCPRHDRRAGAAALALALLCVLAAAVLLWRGVAG